MSRSRNTVVKGAVVGAVLGLAGVGLGMVAGCQDRTVEVSLEKGVKEHDVKVGQGPAAEEGNMVAVHYVGRLSDGTVVVDTHSNGKPHRFIVGDGTVIPGMDEAVRGMRAGGVRDVTMPAHSAYGRMGYAGVIPPRATLTFEIEMVRVSREGAVPMAWRQPTGP